MRKLKLVLVVGGVVLGVLLTQCKSSSGTTASTDKGEKKVVKSEETEPERKKSALDCAEITFTANVSPIFEERCTKCHGGTNPKHGIDLTNIEGAKKAVGHKLMCVINSGENCPKMPPFGPRLTEEEISIIDCWIKGGMN